MDVGEPSQWRARVVALAIVAGLGVAVWAGLSGPEADAGDAPVAGSRSVSESGGDVEPWPFTVGSGVLACERMQVTFEAGGVTYGLNGTARSHGGYPEPGPIWAEDPELGLGLKVSMGPMIEAGLALC